ncbi:hypothetical protein AAVH_11471 [Aphelenchoides avenae]|nr:hypothetical protein AAVH_11471 [Aphelenchus avenae]
MAQLHNIRYSIKGSSKRDDVDCLLERVQRKFLDVFSSRDLEAIADLYHPAAVLTRSDGLCFYRRDGVIEDYKDFVNQVDTFELIPLYNGASPDGEYLFQRGTYRVNNGGEKRYEQIFKKADDGTYLLYHDEFEMP